MHNDARRERVDKVVTEPRDRSYGVRRIGELTTWEVLLHCSAMAEAEEGLTCRREILEVEITARPEGRDDQVAVAADLDCARKGGVSSRETEDCVATDSVVRVGSEIA